jgi:hypothetical protein
MHISMYLQYLCLYIYIVFMHATQRSRHTASTRCHCVAACLLRRSVPCSGVTFAVGMQPRNGIFLLLCCTMTAHSHNAKEAPTLNSCSAPSCLLTNVCTVVISKTTNARQHGMCTTPSTKVQCVFTCRQSTRSLLKSHSVHLVATPQHSRHSACSAVHPVVYTYTHSCLMIRVVRHSPMYFTAITCIALAAISSDERSQVYTYR